jgi:hypothetical protein
MKMLKVAAMIAATTSLGACATVTRGEHTAWEVKTTPPGAQVRTSNGMVCDSTPCSLRMMRKDEFTAVISKEGFKPVTVTVSHKTSGQGGAALAGNVLVGGIIGIGVDAVTGATQDLTPNPVELTLEKADGAAAPMAAPPPMASPAPPTAMPPAPPPPAAVAPH